MGGPKCPTEHPDPSQMTFSVCATRPANPAEEQDHELYEPTSRRAHHARRACGTIGSQEAFGKSGPRKPGPKGDRGGGASKGGGSPDGKDPAHAGAAAFC